MSTTLKDRLSAIARSFDIPLLVRDVGREVAPQWATALPRETVNRIGRLVISGCGDSLFAGIAARLAIERLTGLPCEPQDALECGRYAALRFGPDVAVLAISNSGTTSRVIESLALAGRAGALPLALTGAQHSPFERVAAGIVVRPVAGAGKRDGPTARVERHLGEYLATLVALIRWALHLGVARGVISDAQRRAEINVLLSAAEMAQRAALEGPDRLGEILPRLADADRVFYLGAGPSYGTALFGAAKLLEEVPLCTIPQHLEEWAHEQYFLTMMEGSRSRVVVIAPPGASAGRAAEILRSIRENGGVGIGVTSSRENAVLAEATASLVVDGECPEEYTPLPYAVPMQLLGIALAFHHGHTVVPLSRRDAGGLIRSSAIVGAAGGHRQFGGGEPPSGHA